MKKYLLLAMFAVSMTTARCGFHAGAEIEEPEAPEDVEVEGEVEIEEE